MNCIVHRVTKSQTILSDFHFQVTIKHYGSPQGSTYRPTFFIYFQDRVHHTTNYFFELCLKIILGGHSFPLFMITDERRFSQSLRRRTFATAHLQLDNIQLSA